ncbi:MAG TPA: head-tail connector protein [Sphingomonadales bacterium]|nr:head-tail connector protein [Sphingomonadales bacterium]
MNPAVITPPALEPVSLAEAKAHLKIDHADEDGVIASLILAARQFCERYTRGALVEQTLKWTLSSWREEKTWGSLDGCFVPDFGSLSFIEIPVGPLREVVSITTYDEAGAGSVWGAENYYLSTAQARIYRRAGASWPKPGRRGDGIEILYTAGFGDAAEDVPPILRRGILMLVAHLYLNREAVSDVPLAPVPYGIAKLFDSFRKVSL